jgi:hypothetical protein
MPTGSWPTLAHDRRTGTRQPRKPGPSGPEKTQLPAISATEQQLQLIRRQIQELEQARKIGKIPPEALRKQVECLSTKPPKQPLAEAIAGQRLTGPSRSKPTLPKTARTANDRERPLESGRRPLTSSSQPALLSNCTSLVLFKHHPTSFGSLRLGGTVETLESAALARRDRTSQAKDLEWLRCQRLFDGITWPPGPLNDDMRRAVGKWVRGTLSGPQCRVCLDFLGWPQPFGVDGTQPEVNADGSPLDGALPILAGMPTGTEKGSDDLDYLFSKSSNEIITEAYARAGSCCGELAYVEQIWLACRTLARRTFARCMQSEFPALPAYRTEEIMCEALRQKLVGEGLRPEGAWLRQTLSRKGIQGLDSKPPSKGSAQEELEMYHRRQIYLRKELQRQCTILGKEEAFTIFGVTDQDRLSPSKLKKQYRQMALECHPDKGGDMTRFHKLQTAYTQLASTALANGAKKPAKRVVRGTEAEELRQKVVQVHSFAETCTSAVQRAFCQMSRGLRFKDWVEIVQQSIAAARSAGSAATNVAEQAENLAKSNAILKDLNGLSDAIEACESAGEDTSALSERTLEAVEEAVKMNPTDRRLTQVSQQRILALALHAALAATDAGMSSSEVGHCIQWAKEPEEKDEEPVVQKTQAAPPPPSTKTDGPLGRSPREEDESKSDAPPKPEPPKKPEVKEEAENAVSSEHKELVHRVSALNTDLLHMQQQLHSRLTNTTLQASLTTKSKVFGLIAAFMDEACVEFGKRLQSKSTLHSALDNSLWWLLDESSIALAVPPGVQSVILRSALGLDAEAVRTLVRDELMPRLWLTAAKMRGRRASLSARSSSGNLLSPEDDALMRDCEDRLMTHLKPMQPRGSKDTP